MLPAISISLKLKTLATILKQQQAKDFKELHKDQLSNRLTLYINHSLSKH